jgi:hypothetical protein
MSDRCPTEGYACVHQLVSRVQAVADQAGGLVEVVDNHLATPSVAQMIVHYRALVRLLEKAIEGYTDGHGQPPLAADLEGVRWLTMELLS